MNKKISYSLAVVAVLVAAVGVIVGARKQGLIHCAVATGSELIFTAKLCSNKSSCSILVNQSFSYERGDLIVFDLNVTVPDAARFHNQSLYMETSVETAKKHKVLRIARSELTFYSPRPPVRMYLLDPFLAWLRPDDEEVRKRLKDVEEQRLHQNESALKWRPGMKVFLGVENATYNSLDETPQLLRTIVDWRTGAYFPPMISSFLVATREDESPEVNNSEQSAVMPLRIELSRTGSWKVMWLGQLEQALVQQKDLGFSARDIDDAKSIFLDTHPVVLGVTVVVSTLHIIFDILATKNDVSFWRSRNGDLRGISASTVLFNAVAHLVVLLYLYDNETSQLVLLPALLGCLVDWWKVTKSFKFVRNGWRISIERRVSEENNQEQITAESDKKAYGILLYFLIPVVIAFSCYRLIYVPQKSWYSWVLGSLTSLLYALGFVMMTPQLFINYKLKTVAHLPWRALVYRSLNTFIDDLFAFIIKMPMMHRISCFRDDIVFFIYLYQRFIYPVDETRVEGMRGGVTRVPKEEKEEAPEEEVKPKVEPSQEPVSELNNKPTNQPEVENGEKKKKKKKTKKN